MKEPAFLEPTEEVQREPDAPSPAAPGLLHPWQWAGRPRLTVRMRMTAGDAEAPWGEQDTAWKVSGFRTCFSEICAWSLLLW